MHVTLRQMKPEATAMNVGSKTGGNVNKVVPLLCVSRMERSYRSLPHTAQYPRSELAQSL